MMSLMRIHLYIDNSNIFRGCKKSGWRPSYRKVHEWIAATDGPIAATHFFASEQEAPREKQARFYRALRGDLGFTLHLCRLAQRRVSCPKCGHVEWVPAEKGVDVGLSSQLLIDYIDQAFDLAVVMSSDRDYMDAVLKVAAGGKKVKLLAWKWTLPQPMIGLCEDQNIQLVFLENLKDQIEKPQGEVL